MMSDTLGNIKKETYTETIESNYRAAKPELTTKIEETSQFSVKVRTVTTGRTDGNIKFRVAPREMPKPKSTNSTK